MAQISTNEMRGGMKVELDGQPYVIVSNEFVKPGKGQAFNRIKVKHIMTGRVIERVLKSGEKLDLADVEDKEMRLLFKDADGATFMDELSFEQTFVPIDIIAETSAWLKEDLLYTVTFYRGNPVSITPPMFLELTIVETAPGARGDTVSGRVLKPAILESGAKIQVPIFVDQGEKIKIDTRTGEYVSRV
jgi:elongation factor P